MEVGMGRVGDKGITFLEETLSKLRLNYVFGRNALQIAIFWYFIVLPPYPLPKHMTGGSAVRGKTRLIWLRKV
jgi:hypothetical protein